MNQNEQDQIQDNMDIMERIANMLRDAQYRASTLAEELNFSHQDVQSNISAMTDLINGVLAERTVLEDSLPEENQQGVNGNGN